MIPSDISNIDRSTAQTVADGHVECILNHYSASGALLTPALDFLLALALHRNPEIARIGTNAIFGSIVEQLSDSFEPRYCDLYDRIFAHLISVFCTTQQGQPVRALLSRFGIRDREGLLARRARMRSQPVVPPWRSPSLVVVLSRITLGADVACTSVVISAVRHLYPHAEVLFAGPEASYQLFRGDPMVRHLHISYDRHGTFADRIASWLRLVEALDAELARRGQPEHLVIDPDSRLTQLGILPIVDDDRRYHYFESRSYRREGMAEIGRLTAVWMSERFGSPADLLPATRLSQSDIQLADDIRTCFRKSGADRVVSVSFGVGGNQRKRIGAAFEKDLLRAFLQRGLTVVVTCGGSREEVNEVRATAENLAREGWTLVKWQAQDLRYAKESAPRPPALVLWQGDTGAFAAAIRAGDLYVGYDSAGQHLAAAMSVPTVCIFTAGMPRRHMERWKACGPGPVRCIQASGPADALPAVLQATDDLLGSR
ncbi:MAG: glycosyltransferase family 9 protein [Armatimonadota bacterium]